MRANKWITDLLGHPSSLSLMHPPTHAPIQTTRMHPPNYPTYTTQVRGVRVSVCVRGGVEGEGVVRVRV